MRSFASFIVLGSTLVAFGFAVDDDTWDPKYNTHDDIMEKLYNLGFLKTSLEPIHITIETPWYRRNLRADLTENVAYLGFESFFGCYDYRFDTNASKITYDLDAVFCYVRLWTNIKLHGSYTTGVTRNRGRIIVQPYLKYKEAEITIVDSVDLGINGTNRKYLLGIETNKKPEFVLNFVGGIWDEKSDNELKSQLGNALRRAFETTMKSTYEKALNASISEINLR